MTNIEIEKLNSIPILARMVRKVQNNKELSIVDKKGLLNFIYLNRNEILFQLANDEPLRDKPNRDDTSHWRRYKEDVDKKKEMKSITKRKDKQKSIPHPTRQAILSEDGKILGWKSIETSPLTASQWAETKTGRDALRNAIQKLLNQFPFYRDSWKIEYKPIKRGLKFFWEIRLII